MRLLVLLTGLLFFCSCKDNTRYSPEVVQYETSYEPARFTDSDRVSKIRQYLPVIDSIYRKHAEDNHFPGISFGIVVDGELIYKNSYGYTDVAKKIPATSSSMFRIASMSKSFTAMAIL